MKENVRKQGILLPVSSIPSAYGIGTFGRESYRFVDFLEKSGNRLWQILPLGPTGYGDSPYQSFSTFAGNPYYIDLEILIEEGLLTKEICDGYDFGDNEHYVDYEKIYLSRFKVLKIAFYCFQQYLFAKQWKELKTYANKKGIEIVGDIPIYVAFDSADTWANPKLFQLDREGRPIGVAGCPPDCFSETGQLWGNPLYDWKYHKKTGYEWWMQRIAYCYQLYDVLRIDHFRGFDEYWFVPYGDPTAQNGHWEKGPGYELFAVMKKKLGKKKVIAEDLGFLTPSVIRLVKKTGYPGMKILQFAFDAGNDSEYLPHNYDKNCVVYTGTHDNDTTVGFIQNMPEKDKKFAKKYLGHKNDKKLCFEIVRAALSSCADTAVIPMQDYLELDSSARINIPSTLGCNWKWRMDKEALDPKLAKKIYKMAKLYGRL